MTTLEDVRAILTDQRQGFPQIFDALLDYAQHLEDRIAQLERDRRPWHTIPEMSAPQSPPSAATLNLPLAPVEGGGPAPAPEAP